MSTCIFMEWVDRKDRPQGENQKKRNDGDRTESLMVTYDTGILWMSSVHRRRGGVPHRKARLGRRTEKSNDPNATRSHLEGSQSHLEGFGGRTKLWRGGAERGPFVSKVMAGF